MLLSLKTKQVVGVTLFVGLVVVLLSAWYVSSLATVWLGETQKRADMLAQAIFSRRLRRCNRIRSIPCPASRTTPGCVPFSKPA